MKSVILYDAKPYDKIFFEQYKDKYQFEIIYEEAKLNRKTAVLAKGCDGVCAFVNDLIDKETIEVLSNLGIKVIAMRCAGYNNIDFKEAYGKVHVVRVPAYSPYAVAEFAIGMILMLNRKLGRAINRTKEHNFSISGLEGFDLHGKTIGVVGTGKIGQTFIDVISGFGMRILAYDPYPSKSGKYTNVSFEELCKESDIISLHCPLTKESHHIINKKSLEIMKDGVYIINTSRGALIDSEDLLEAIKDGKVGAAGLDVYEEETEVFFEDYSNSIIKDDILARLISMPNVIVTSHQAFLTYEALSNIAETTLDNLQDFFNGDFLSNEICYQCINKNGNCHRKENKNCF